MASSADDEKQHWGQVMDHLDLLSQRLNDMGITQQEVKQQLTATNLKVDQCTADQRFIAQQVKANGQTVAQLTAHQFENEAGSVSAASVIADDKLSFENVFADKWKHSTRPEPSHHFKTIKQPHKTDNSQHHATRTDTVPHHALPKMLFPTSNGTQPKIWLDKCLNYFHIYKMSEDLWVEAATMHLQENAAKWWQTYKATNSAVTWQQFCADLQEQFGGG